MTDSGEKGKSCASLNAPLEEHFQEFVEFSFNFRGNECATFLFHATCSKVCILVAVLRCHLSQMSWHNNLMQFITARKAKQNLQKFFAIIKREEE